MHVNDTNNDAILPGEERHCTRFDRRLVLHFARRDVAILPNMFVYLLFDALKHIVRDRAMVLEIEAQPIRRYDRPGLLNVGTENPPQSSMHEVGRRMVTLDITTS